MKAEHFNLGIGCLDIGWALATQSSLHLIVGFCLILVTAGIMVRGAR